MSMSSGSSMSTRQVGSSARTSADMPGSCLANLKMVRQHHYLTTSLKRHRLHCVTARSPRTRTRNKDKDKKKDKKKAAKDKDKDKSKDKKKKRSRSPSPDRSSKRPALLPGMNSAAAKGAVLSNNFHEIIVYIIIMQCIYIDALDNLMFLF